MSREDQLKAIVKLLNIIGVFIGPIIASFFIWIAIKEKASISEVWFPIFVSITISVMAFWNCRTSYGLFK